MTHQRTNLAFAFVFVFMALTSLACSSPASSGDASTGDTSTATCSASHPAIAACETCVSASECHVIDNPCNDDSVCNAAQNAWKTCLLCDAKQLGKPAADCDATYNSASSKAAAVIACTRDKCPQCY
jgi:hypothetical protein